ncbi:MAG TPA: DivIVA domain-containing protein [Marmoricola sp.]|nr:DivIVA domain-containing protein [Marmoricola sp.]
MMWLFAVLVVLAIGAIAVVAAGRGTPMQEEYDDRPDVFLPADRPLESGDLKAVRFSLAVRGYRMAEVDALLSRLARQLEEAAGDPVPLALPAPDEHRGNHDQPPGAEGQAGPAKAGEEPA